jgi:DNA-binding NarL/FixJ family response regulator
LRTVRVVLGTMSQMLRDVLRELLDGQGGMEVAGEARSDQELLAVLSGHTPDVVVVEAMQGTLGYIGALVLHGEPLTTVLAISVDSRKAVLYQIKAAGSALRNVSAEDLRQAIRGSSATPA